MFKLGFIQGVCSNDLIWNTSKPITIPVKVKTDQEIFLDYQQDFSRIARKCNCAKCKIFRRDMNLDD